MMRFLENRVRSDSEDFGAYNKLAGLYLQRARETDDLAFLELAKRAAQSSLAIIPPEQNTGGLGALAQAEFSAHDFTSARDHARQLTKIDGGKSYPYLLLGDALLELGDYEEAERTLRQAVRVGGGISQSSEPRFGRLALLRGDHAQARNHYANALALALNSAAPSGETVAWLHWQLGETAFATGDYAAAERHYRDALTTLPDYLRAVAALGRARAAQGDLPAGIKMFEQVVQRLPDPTFIATLGDFYSLAGREAEAAAQYKLVEQIARLSETNGVLYNRQLALFYADHDLKPQEAYALALKEYETRRDIYGADAVAWTAFKAGKIEEAQAAMKEALRLGTRDARLFYHAGLIARAAGDKSTARNSLQQALKLNPQFDPLQASRARLALEE